MSNSLAPKAGELKVHQLKVFVDPTHPKATYDAKWFHNVQDNNTDSDVGPFESRQAAREALALYKENN